MRMLSGERQAALMGQDRDYAHVVRGCIRQGQQDGSIRPDIDPHLTSLAILGALNWVYRWYQPGGRYSPAHIGRQYADLFTTALRAPKQSGTRAAAASRRG